MPTTWTRRPHHPFTRAILATVALLALATVLAPLASATVGEHPLARTPGSRQAAIFSPFGTSWDDLGAMIYVRKKLEDHNYAVTVYGDPTEAADDDPFGATAANFRQVSRLGAVFIISHGDTDDPATPDVVEPNLLLVETYQTAAARNAALAAYGAPFAPGHLAACDQFADHAGQLIFGICITEAGVAAQFADNHTIVHVAACHSFTFAEEFNAREYFGYRPSIGCADIRADAERLWGRLHGEVDDGHHRAARVAFEAGGFSAGFAYRKKPNADLDTVLAPAVSDHWPPKDHTYTVPTLDPNAYVVFDVPMDTTVDPARVIRVKDCDARIKNPRWAAGGMMVKFELELNAPGKATLTVLQEHARAGSDYKNNLDGNLTPAKGEHIGPNRDDYVWTVNCVQHQPTHPPRTPRAPKSPRQPHR